MLDFETVRLRAPYRAAISQRDGETVEQEVEDVFEATVRCIRP
jgi:hypothetical protein